MGFNHIPELGAYISIFGFLCLEIREERKGREESR